MDINAARPFFSICVPAYNRAGLLPELLDSIFSQDEQDFEIVICEDGSKERDKISEVVRQYQKQYPNKISYYENVTNLGYDKNFRELISKSNGRYCYFLGNDDLMAEQALASLKKWLNEFKDIGFVLRTYAMFTDSPKNIDEVAKYFPDRRVFEPGIQTITTCFKRSVVICGLVFDRDLANSFSTNEFDGTLLYQQHLVSEILKTKRAFYDPQIIAYYRNGGTPDFGNSASEKQLHVPGQQTPASSINFMKGMLKIAKAKSVGEFGGLYQAIVEDLTNYSYPFISIQAHLSKVKFFSYYRELMQLGFGKKAIFHLYFLALFILGRNNCDALIKFIKKQLGYTPKLGNVSSGQRTS